MKLFGWLMQRSTAPCRGTRSGWRTPMRLKKNHSQKRASARTTAYARSMRSGAGAVATVLIGYDDAHVRRIARARERERRSRAPRPLPHGHVSPRAGRHAVSGARGGRTDRARGARAVPHARLALRDPRLGGGVAEI